MSKGTCKRCTKTFQWLLDCGCKGLCPLQISAIKVLLNDLKGGLSKVNTEILKAAGVDANSAFAHRQFGDLMMTFHEHAKSTFADAEVTLHLIAAFTQQQAENQQQINTMICIWATQYAFVQSLTFDGADSSVKQSKHVGNPFRPNLIRNSHRKH